MSFSYQAARKKEIADLVRSGLIETYGIKAHLAKKYGVSRNRISQLVDIAKKQEELNPAVRRSSRVDDRRKKVAEIIAQEGKPSFSRIKEIGKMFGVGFSAIYADIKAINAATPDVSPAPIKTNGVKARIIDETSCRYGDVGEVSAISDAGIFVRFEDGCLGRFSKAACRVRIPAEVA